MQIKGIGEAKAKQFLIIVP
ncbi:hypothetical protein [Helicobacter sp.]